ncbi:related to Avl9 protein [Cephalotrichum gorgonifer]|uniref:Related to Avl9 protein n=1 Tax=Cephalotrichum gorgonifer TaxID=2041049 RepID=A0AAE8MT37_9PEZI|nr:related to Avl9 protein [Cephalotrichum gorgonifer]
MSDVNPNPNPSPAADAAGGSSPPARPSPTTADIPLGTDTDTDNSPPITDIPLDDDDVTSPPAPPPAAPPLSVPPTPSFPEPLTPSRVGFIPLITVVGFHHARGPEVESWFGVEEGHDPAAEYGWTLLPFMALSDGAHATEEDFSYFTLLRPETPTSPATSLFGISCTRQLDSSQLLNRPADVTRSTVQKAVVVIADNPQAFGMLRERLSIVTRAWFAQREFSDVDILKGLQESLADEKRRGLMGREDGDANLGMSLRELVHEFKWQALVLLKACLLQPKMLFFGSRCDRLCMLQFSLISLIPNLIRNLQDCADPELNAYEKNLKPPTSLRTSDRQSLLQYMGLPLQIFGKGSLFGPYTPLQQLDILADFGTKSYIVGSTNSLLLQQRDRYSDVLVNLDDNSISITSPSLRSALSLTASDRRWIDYLAAEVNETWDELDPGRPTTMRYVGSEEFIRLQFEEYILSLIASVRYHQYMTARANNPADTGLLLPHVEGDPSLDFGAEWVEAWKGTENYRIWNGTADSHLFDIVDPRHPCAGGLTMEDVQRRIAEQVRELHLDERLAQGREALGRNLAFGKEKAGTVLNKLYADMESFREAQRKRNEEAAAAAAARKGADNGEPLSPSGSFGGVDLNKAQQTVSSVGARAGAYVSSWASWAGEKRKGGFGSGWGLGGGKSSKSTREAGGLMGQRGVGAGTGGSGSGSEEFWGGAGDDGYSSLVDKRASGSSAGTYDLKAEDALVTGEGFVAVEKPGDYSGEGGRGGEKRQ